MSATTQEKLTFDQFMEACPESGIYELINGEIVEVRATRNHEDVADLIYKNFAREIDRLELNYVVKRTAVIKTLTSAGEEQGRNPDVSAIDRRVWRSNRSDYNALEVPIQLAVEVTSTNWDDDYVDKLDEYQRLGIPEYWIVDYLAIASREYLGNPKVPTVFVFLLDENGQYQRHQFRGADRIISRRFPELALTAEQMFMAQKERQRAGGRRKKGRSWLSGAKLKLLHDYSPPASLSFFVELHNFHLWAYILH
ncbi:Uma2 family endonuclease [Microseira sp. BLCC-F43]|jgi:Uma2 family endonuclease|uniref:Uma2 family endonuclease n=1 Tax=Microseira sp. BLCC-F43 TaxID=3153602 RepID=UPI0035B93A1F